MTDNMKVYMAGPIQHAHDDGKGWRQRVKERYDYIEWLDPFDKYDSTEPEDQIREMDEVTEEYIVEEDLKLIHDSDAVLVHWENVPSVGTPMEIRYAYVNDIPVVLQTTVDDPSPWLTYHADSVHETFDEAVVETCYAAWESKTKEQWVQ